MTDNKYTPPLPEYSLTPGDFTLEHWLPRGTRERLDLNAPYQRGSVWDDQRRRNLIKSILMKLPIGAVTIAHLGYDQTHPERVIDGKQRILTVRAFFADEFGVPGGWLHPMCLTDPLDRDREVRFRDLSDRGQRILENASLPSRRFDPTVEKVRAQDGSWTSRDRTPGEALAAEAELYLLINFGGVAQSGDDFQRAAAIASTAS